MIEIFHSYRADIFYFADFDAREYKFDYDSEILKEINYRKNWEALSFDQYPDMINEIRGQEFIGTAENVKAAYDIVKHKCPEYLI